MTRTLWITPDQATWKVPTQVTNFGTWVDRVETHVFQITETLFGTSMGIDMLHGDWRFADAYESGVKPEIAARELIKESELYDYFMEA